ncbi:unnamed protein product [Thlaspi arvense]|uniref:F-box domain-containing protein n=1 Tax=Thlaspi arvense TaxID=13288 RepID=A0AAU9T0Y9_THLAR|nr:unnamed protein product [Thlaspi arvense]
MTQEERLLPWELTEEILSRVPPRSLVRFRAVSKQWKALIDDKTFINNHKSAFRFILTTYNKIYSVSIDPKIVLRELTLDVPGLETQTPNNVVDCDEFLLCDMYKGSAVIWNPWLNQTRWIKAEPELRFEGLGYDSNVRVRESVYKTIWSSGESTEWMLHGLDSEDAWKDLMSKYGGQIQEERRCTIHSETGVALNGTLYWVAFLGNKETLSLLCFDFSRELFSRFCALPCGMSHDDDAVVLGVFKGDRLSLLKQCYKTKKIEIWVTSSKIDVGGGADVIWTSFMSIPDFPGLFQTETNCEPSYFIEDKRLVVCSCDKTGKAWIYVAGENKLISKVQLDSVVGHWPLHCTYCPSLVPVPRGQREETELQV